MARPKRPVVLNLTLEEAHYLKELLRMQADCHEWKTRSSMFHKPTLKKHKTLFEGIGNQLELGIESAE